MHPVSSAEASGLEGCPCCNFMQDRQMGLDEYTKNLQEKHHVSRDNSAMHWCL